MKNPRATFLLLAVVALTGRAALAHHAAEGIVSDDIWQMIDSLLEAADSPHLDLDFTMMDRVIITTVEVDSSMVDTILGELGSINNGRLVLTTQVTEPGLTEIIVVEPIGAGESQIVYQ